MQVLCIVCLKVVVLTLAPGWAAAAAGSTWLISGPSCLLKQQASSVHGGERSHAGSILRIKPSSPFLSPSSNTHRVPTTHTHTRHQGSLTRERLAFHPFLNESFICSRHQTRRSWPDFISAIMWSRDGKIVAPPRTLMLLLTCYYAVIKSENTIWCWRHFENWRSKDGKMNSGSPQAKNTPNLHQLPLKWTDCVVHISVYVCVCVVERCRKHITLKYVRLNDIILFHTFKVITHSINLSKGLCVRVFKHCTKVCVFVCVVRLQIAEQKKPLPVPPSSGCTEYYYLRVCQRAYR